MSQEDFYYSTRYEDDFFEYRHVHVPWDIARKLPKSRLLTESEWRTLGVQQSLGWVHYMIHGPERHVMLFRRPKPGVDPAQAAAVAEIRDAGKDLDEPVAKASPEKGSMEWSPDEVGDSNDDNKSGEKKPKSDDKDVQMI